LDITQYLIAAIVAQTGAILFLFKLVLSGKNKELRCAQRVAALDARMTYLMKEIQRLRASYGGPGPGYVSFEEGRDV
jgi:hypothetical protein